MLSLAEGTRRNAGELLQDPDATVAAPGHSPEACMVLSYAGKAPQLVTPVNGGVTVTRAAQTGSQLAFAHTQWQWQM